VTRPPRLATGAVALAAAALLAACTGGSGGSAGHRSGVPRSSPGPVAGAYESVAPLAAHGPQPPADGAWVGAWVKPPVARDDARPGAFAAFEQAVGHPLTVAHVFHTWTEPFPTAGDAELARAGKVLMISWSGTDSSAITAGTYDAMIRQRADAVRAFGAPVLLRWRWEMNRPNLRATVGSPEQYVAAWRHIRAIFTEAGATNVGWVWCPMAATFTSDDGAAYYPGDDQVDWLCTDVYAIGTGRSFADVAADFMTWAGGHDKPVVVGEYGSNLTDPAAKAAWIAGATTYARAHPQIRALVYFDALRTENGQERDFRVEAAAAPLAAYRAMLADPWFGG